MFNSNMEIYKSVDRSGADKRTLKHAFAESQYKIEYESEFIWSRWRKGFANFAHNFRSLGEEKSPAIPGRRFTIPICKDRRRIPQNLNRSLDQ